MNNEPNYFQELRSYLIGFVFALVLTIIPFAVVAWGGMAFVKATTVIVLCALIQVVVHFRYFLHINLSRQKREDLQLILFSVLLLTIMAGGTVWIMANLAARMH